MAEREKLTEEETSLALVFAVFNLRHLDQKIARRLHPGYWWVNMYDPEEGVDSGSFLKDVGKCRLLVEAVNCALNFSPQSLPKADENIESAVSSHARILRMRFGIDDGRPKTLKEIARRFRVSGSRIVEIERRAIRILRHSSRREFFQPLLELFQPSNS